VRTLPRHELGTHQIYDVEELYVDLSRTVSFQDFQYREHSMGGNELREHFRGVREDRKLGESDYQWVTHDG
jgi:hypothetical protein